MTSLDIGAGAREVLSQPGAGTVQAVYSKAAYLRFPRGLVAVTDARAPRGPLHLRCAALPGMRAGDRVATTGTGLRVGRTWVSLACPTWRPAAPPAAALAARRQLAADAAGRLPPSPLLAGADVLVDPHWAGRVGAGDIEALARHLGGRGPGLTPAGDDVLAGLLLTARLLWGAEAEPRLAGIAAAVRTNDIAAAFLAWAARGHLIEPAHRLLEAVAAGHEAPARGWVDELLTFGHSSGRELVSGIALGLGFLPVPGGAGQRTGGARTGR